MYRCKPINGSVLPVRLRLMSTDETNSSFLYINVINIAIEEIQTKQSMKL